MTTNAQVRKIAAAAVQAKAPPKPGAHHKTIKNMPDVVWRSMEIAAVTAGVSKRTWVVDAIERKLKGRKR